MLEFLKRLICADSQHTTVRKPVYGVLRGPEALEERFVLDGYTWSPTFTTNASLPENWKKNGVQQGTDGTLPGNNSNDVVVMDGNVSFDDIVWTYSPQVAKMTLQNGYHGLQTIVGNNQIILTGGTGIGAFGMGTTGNDQFNLKFTESDDEFEVLGGADFINFSITNAAGQVGTLIIYGGTTTIAANVNFEEKLDCNIILGNGGVVNDLGQSALIFGDTNKNLWFRINSQSSFYLAGGNNPIPNILITSKTTGNYFDVNGGKFGYAGVGVDGANRVNDIIDVAIFVENSGVFAVSGGAFGSEIGSNLEVDGSYTDPNSGKTASVYMSGGSIQLSQFGSLQCGNDYYQSGGLLETMDAEPFSIVDGSSTTRGTANIVGGTVKMAQSIMQPQYGSLLFFCDTLNFAGTYAPKINGQISGESDVLKVFGTLNIDPDSSNLQVAVVGGLGTKGTEDWTIISNANNQLKRFANTNNTTTGLTDTPNQPGNGSYQVSW